MVSKLIIIQTKTVHLLPQKLLFVVRIHYFSNHRNELAWIIMIAFLSVVLIVKRAKLFDFARRMSCEMV